MSLSTRFHKEVASIFQSIGLPDFNKVTMGQARPQAFSGDARPSFTMGGDQYIIGGTDAAPGEFPWQLSQQRLGTIWSHSCGASLLSSNYGLSAAHCVDKADPSILRVIAGLHQRSDETGTQTVNISSYKMHEEYEKANATVSNDIAILTFASAIVIGGNIQVATLPADNSNDYAGLTCIMTGWGRTDNSQVLPDTLQKASIPVITTADCQRRMKKIATVWKYQICLFDTAKNVGSCNGDSGGPLNCPDSGTRVAGITSWGASSGGNCLQTYPSVYTRVSAYLAWIAANTP